MSRLSQLCVFINKIARLFDSRNHHSRVFVNFIYAKDAASQGGVDIVAKLLIPCFEKYNEFNILSIGSIRLLPRLMIKNLPHSRFFVESLYRTKYRNSTFINFNYYLPLSFIGGAGQNYTVIHDLLWLDNPEGMARLKRIWMSMQLRRSVKCSDKIVAVSEFTKSRIEHWFPDAANKVTVIPNPIDINRFSLNQNDTRILDLGSEVFFLCISSNSPHKNLSTLLQAFHELIKEVEVNLVLIGPSHGNSMPMSLQYEKSSNRVRYLGFVDDRSLGVLYQKCLAVISPSTYEGFGITNFEALALGKPVIASKIDTVPRAGNVVLVNDFVDVTAWHRTIRQFISSYRENRKNKPLNVDTYAPEKVALKYLELVVSSK